MQLLGQLPMRPLLALLCLVTLSLARAGSVSATEIDDLSLEDLVNTTITTASKFSQNLSEAPSNATVVRGEEIRSHGWRNLNEALESIPGFQITNVTDLSYLGVRGFSVPDDFNSRILLLIDGIPINEGMFDQALIGPIPAFPLDMNLIERIEVVPGPGSALYGGNAYLAVINVITRESTSIGRSVTIGLGNDGLTSGQVSAGGKNADGQHWLISASAERSDGEDRFFPQWKGIAGSDGWAHGLDGERQRKVFLRYGNEDWSVQLLHAEDWKDAAGAMYGSDFSAAFPSFDTTTQLGLRFHHPLNNTWALEGQAYLGQYTWTGSYRYSGVWIPNLASSDWLGANAQITGKPSANQTLVLGAAEHDDYHQRMQNAGFSIGPRTTESLYAQDEIRFNDTFTLNLGGRYDNTFDSSQFSPRTALMIHLPAAMVLKLMSGKAFRPPNFYQTSYASPGLQLAGGNLKPERITTDEIALERPIGTHGRWTASLYRNRFKDLIAQATDPTTGIAQIQNVGGARTQGVELSAHYRFDNGLDLRGSLSWQDSENRFGVPLSDSPRQLAKLIATVPIGAYEMGWETYYVGPRHDSFGGPVGGETISNVAFSGRVSRDLSWQLRATNLFDRRLYLVAGTDYSFGAVGNVPTIQDYGRQVQVRLTLDF